MQSISVRRKKCMEKKNRGFSQHYFAYIPCMIKYEKHGVHTHTHTHTCMYMYIYIYIHYYS